MYQFTGFSEKANLALNNAVNCAEDMGHTYIGTEHVVAGLLKDPSSVAGVVLRSRKVTYNGLYEKIRANVGVGIPTELTINDMTPRCRRIIENAVGLSSCSHDELTGTEHILMAVLRDSKCIASRLLGQMGVSAPEMCADIMNALPSNGQGSYRLSASEPGAGRTERSTLAKYGTDLTGEAKAGRIDPVCGRTREIDRVIRILCRRTKNNPCLIGEPGVGKTAVVEGLALRIAAGDVPEALKNTELRSLELTGMVAGAKYRGDFEERIRSAVKEVRAAGNIILFIDEIHNLIGAGSAEGAVDAANILKPVLARGEIRLIGATTFEEYRKNIEKDAALERRFQTVSVREPTAEQTMEILRDIRPRYEAHHRISISDAALEACVGLSVRYLTDRFLPDKAIDLMDEAAAGVSLSRSAYPADIEEMRRESEQLNRKKAEAVNAQDFEKAVCIRDTEKELNRKLSAAKAQWSENGGGTVEVTPEDVAGVVSERTGIPVNCLTVSDRERLAGLEETLRESIVGQDEAIRAVASAVRRGRSGIRDPERPIGSFLFCGPTGVGKTALAKALAPAVFGDKEALIRLDMSEFSERHTVSRLVGAPPGYVGFEEGGKLIEKIRRRPYSVILFDEIEKAHPDIFNSLLQLLEEGVITASDGRSADCRSCIVIMTSNLGAGLTAGTGAGVGFSEKNAEKDRLAARREVKNELKKTFRPEFINRIDEIVMFDRLKKEDVALITRRGLDVISLRLSRLGITAVFDEKAEALLAEKGFDEAFGARHLRRLLVKEVEDPLSQAMIGGELKTGGKAEISASERELLFKFT